MATLRIFEEGIADFETIDSSLKTLEGLEWALLNSWISFGNDVNYAVTESVFEAFYYDSKFALPLLKSDGLRLVI